MQVPENLEIMKKMGVIPSLYFLNPGGKKPTLSVQMQSMKWWQRTP